MKSTLIIISLFTCLLVNSQNSLFVKSGGRVFDENKKKIAPSEVRALMKNNLESLELYNIGRTKKTLGNILLIGGTATVLGNLAFQFTEPNGLYVQGYDGFGTPILTKQTKDYTTLYVVGAAMIVIAIPIKIGFTKKIRKSIDLMNSDLKNPKIGFNIESTSFISNSNGIGFSITF